MRARLALSLLAGASFVQTPAPAPDADPVVEAAAAYVRQYQEQLTSVVADEVYSQNVKAQIPVDRGMPHTRTLRSEIFFMFAPGQDWMAIRDVMELDRHPVADRRDLRDALAKLPTQQVAREFKNYNSRFNLGRVSRNFNEPTLSLLVLDDRHRARFAFERVRTQIEKGEEYVTVAFRERRPPTLIWNLKLEPVFSWGELTIHSATGRISRAQLSLTIDTVRITLTTTYGAEKRLGMWVPVRFGEHYRDGTDVKPPTPPRGMRGRQPEVPQASAYFEEIVCEARYSNYRQFEVKARIR